MDAISLGGSVVDDAWHGIDLHNVRATRRVGKLLCQNLSVAIARLRDRGPAEAGGASLSIADDMQVLSPATPFAEFRNQFFDPEGVLIT